MHRITNNLRLIFVLWIFYYGALSALSFASHYHDFSFDLKSNLSLIGYNRIYCDSVLIPLITNFVNGVTSIIMLHIYNNLYNEKEIRSNTTMNPVHLILWILILVSVLFYLFADLSQNDFSSLYHLNIYTSIFFGLISCVTFSLVLARLDSKFIDLPVWWVILLFVYAAMQIIYPSIIVIFGIEASNIDVKSINYYLWQIFVIFSLFSKALFYFLFYDLLKDHKLFIYFLKVANEKNSPNVEKEMEKLLK